MKQAFPCCSLKGWQLFVLSCMLMTVPALALAQDPLEGEWEGDLTMPDGTARHIIVELIQGAEGGWSGKIQSPTDRTQYLELTRLSVSGSAVSYRFTNPSDGETAIFSGNYQAWNDLVKGIFRVRGFSLPIQMARVGAGIEEGLEGELAEGEEEAKVVRIRHENNFGVTLRGSLWNPVYILKEDNRDINDIATSSSGYDAAVRWYVIDDLALFGRYVKGGLGFDSNEYNLGLFGFTGNEFLEMKGWEVGINAYWGDILFPTSNFNPYATFIVSKIDWTLGIDGRGSDPFVILERPVTAEDYGFGFGFGTEYPLTKALSLEVEWLWRYFMTEDTDVWNDDDLRWTNVNAWSLSLGMVTNF